MGNTLKTSMFNFYWIHLSDQSEPGILINFSYGMVSVFFRSVPPPRVHIHLRLHSDLSSIPSLTSPSPSSTSPTTEPKSSNSSSNGVASPEEAKAFELWLREIWKEKDERLKKFVNDQKFDGIAEIVPVRQM